MRVDDLTGIEKDATEHYISRFNEIERIMNLHAQAQNLGHQEWEDDLMNRIEEMPMEVSLVAIYPPRDECEWEILLGTGGPADRVLVTTDLSGEIQSATYQHQDWFTPWTHAYGQNADVVEQFARFFYFNPVNEDAWRS